MTQLISITSQGQISIPSKVRRLFGLDRTKKVLMEVRGNKIILEPAPDIMELEGIFKKYALTDKPIDEIRKLEKGATGKAFADAYKKEARAMKTYFIDANVYLRFFLQDNKKQAELAKQYFIDAQAEKIKIVITPEMLVEVNYVLLAVYKIPRQSVAETLLKIAQTPYFTIVDSEILLSALHSYQNINVDIEDIILYVRAKQADAVVLSFDEDIKKLQRAIN